MISVRDAIGSALPKPRKKVERPRWKLSVAIAFIDQVLDLDKKARESSAIPRIGLGTHPRRAGLAVSVADGAPELKAVCHYTTHCLAGRGAAREVVELILKAQGRWEEAVPLALA